MPKKYAIIVAAGTGSRLESEVPKQFMELGGKPVLVHSLEKFFYNDRETIIFLVLPQFYINFWEDLAAQYGVAIPHEVIAGGSERFHSVKAALDAIENDRIHSDDLVAIHDAARPMVSKEQIKLAFEVAAEFGSALPAVPVKDSLRKCKDEKWEAVDRKDFKVVQTPQVFKLKLLKEAYHLPYKESFTDDASVYESAGYLVKLMEGEERNIKITTLSDLDFCMYLAENNKL